MAKEQRLIEEGLIPEIVEIADELKEVRSSRMDLTKREKALADRLIEVMHQHNRDYYSYEGKEIEIVKGEEKVKIRGAKEEEAEDAEA